MRKIAPHVQKSIYPLDYNIENPMLGFNDWTRHIRNESVKCASNGLWVKISIIFNIDHCTKVLEVKSEILQNKIMDNLVLVANKIINNNKK